MLTKFQKHILMCARRLTEANGAFTVDGLRRYRLDNYGVNPIKHALNVLEQHGEVLNTGKFYRATRATPITEKARSIGKVLVPEGNISRDLE